MRLKERAKDLFGLAKATWKEFTQDKGTLVAGAISFFTFLSIFPLLLASIGILGIVLGSPEEAQRMILSATRDYAVGSQAKELITQVVRGGNAATGIGLLLLLWSGTTAVVMLEQAVNVAWDVRQKRNFLKQRGIAMLLFLLVGALVLASLGLTALVSYIQSTEASVIPGWSWFTTLFSYLLPLLVITGMFTLVYKILPYTNVTWRAALTGGIFAGVLWEIALQAFTYYVVNFASYNQVYGSLGAVILLLVWINYSAIIVLLGAELASIVQRRREGKRPKSEEQQR